MHSTRIFLLLLMLQAPFLLMAQTVLKGVVRSASDTAPVVGATVSCGGMSVVTDNKGDFELIIAMDEVASLSDTLNVEHVSFERYQRPVTLVTGEAQYMEIMLLSDLNQLDEITISASRFEKKLSEQTVSMEVIKPSKIMNMGLNRMDEAVNRVPGVDVVDQQVNIRGGAGWSYGAGSRVMVLVDEMPMLSADAGDVKWDYLPIENCEQVEVIKGAASALYGSSALNGVINFRTAYAKAEPTTKAMLFNGLYGNPKFSSSRWWGDQTPQFQGGYFAHSRKIGALSLVLGSAWYSEDSYLQGDLSRRGRANINLRYHFKKIPGLIAGVNANAQISRSHTFFFWQPSADYIANIYRPFGGISDPNSTINKNKGIRFNIDPYITFSGQKGWKHSLRTRFYRTENNIPERDRSSRADQYYGEYQIHKLVRSASAWLDELNVVAGLVGSYNDVVGQLYGDHTSSNIAPYIQLEKKWHRLWVSVGGRYEVNQIDRSVSEGRPVMRAGLNYEVNGSSFLRASFGQGYRMPSIAERFIRTDFGASSVFPNPELQSETGHSYEIGFRQLFRAGAWTGYVDLAGFWTQYQNMMEFNFGIYLPQDSTLAQVNNPLDYLGFRSINVGKASIQGVDASLNAIGKVGGVSVTFLAGYTFMNPVQVDPDSAISANLSGPSNMLKYRYRHSSKLDVELNYRNFSIGGTFLYRSFMENIDAVFTNTKPDQNVFGTIFEISTGLPSTINDFRERFAKAGTFVLDLRAGYQLAKYAKLSFLVRNASNALYEVRPALAGAPRNFTIQLMLDL